MKRHITSILLKSNTRAHSFKRILTSLVFAFSILCAPALFAQNEGRWYTVELLVFKRTGGEAFTEENWPSNIELSYPRFYQYLKSADSGNFSLRPSNTHKLGGFNYTLRKDNNYKVLTHKSWRQRMDRESKSPAIVISGGESIDGHRELEGTIKIHIARYLHVSTDLWLTQGKEGSNLTWPVVPTKPGSSSSRSSNKDNSNDVSSAQTSFNLRSYPVATLRERRRMRSKELHYIDHPLMGVLILFTPIGG
ncbi:MAG: CsiV family protein [Cellvibrionaceae bacterium]